MALGPDAVRATRKRKIEKLEEIIDEKIRISDSETVKIDVDDLPGISEYFSDIKTLYEDAGWYDVDLNENYYDKTLILRGFYGG